MKIVGLTGGIGSGKTTIALFFKDLGIPVYVADVEAKRLMNSDSELINKIKMLFGNEAYTKEQQLNRKHIADIVFADKEKLSQLNAIVHPVVNQDFNTWVATHQAPYVIKEAAILFENGGYKQCDYTLLVTAPRNLRIQRVMRRDKATQTEVVSRINMQWSDAKKATLADVVLNNIDLDRTKREVQYIHKHLIRRLSQGWI